MQNKENIIVRECHCDDIPQVARIESETFSQPWTYDNFVETYQQKNRIFLVAQDETEILGYAILYCNSTEGEIPTIAVAEKARKRGIGILLMQELLERKISYGVTDIFLEVRKSNVAAIGLYEKLGFEIVGCRKNFYQLPTEDAYIMAHHAK